MPKTKNCCGCGKEFEKGTRGTTLYIFGNTTGRAQIFGAKAWKIWLCASCEPGREANVITAGMKEMLYAAARGVATELRAKIEADRSRAAAASSRVPKNASGATA